MSLLLEAPAVAESESAGRPLILLDVDGVLNPFTRPGPEWSRHSCTVENGSFKLWLNPHQGAKLLKLAEDTGGDLVWATTWEHHANREIAPILGLPELPVIEVTKGGELDDPAVCWKSPAVAEYVAGRPFVWFDDDLTKQDRKWLEAHPGVGAFRLIHVGCRSGLNDKHLAQAAAWLIANAGGDRG